MRSKATADVFVMILSQRDELLNNDVKHHIWQGITADMFAERLGTLIGVSFSASGSRRDGFGLGSEFELLND